MKVVHTIAPPDPWVIEKPLAVTVTSKVTINPKKKVAIDNDWFDEWFDGSRSTATSARHAGTIQRVLCDLSLGHSILGTSSAGSASNP